MKYRRKTWKKLNPREKELYRQLDNERLERSRKKFIEKHLSTGQFEEKYDSDFENVVVHVEQLFKVGCSRNNFLVVLMNMICEHHITRN